MGGHAVSARPGRTLKIAFNISCMWLALIWTLLLIVTGGDLYVLLNFLWCLGFPLTLSTGLTLLALVFGWFRRPKLDDSLWSLIFLQWLSIVIYLLGFMFSLWL